MAIIFDMDEVLTDLITSVNNYYNRLHGTHFTRADYTTCNWWEVWNCTYEEADRICHDFITGPEGEKIAPFPGSVEGIRKLRKDYQLVVATSRKFEYEDLTRTWLAKTYGSGTFHEVYLLNQYGEEQEPLKKSAIAQTVGARLAVDDQVRHVFDYAAVGVPCLVLDSPWNVDEILPPLAKRVFSWDDLLTEVYRRV